MREQQGPRSDDADDAGAPREEAPPFWEWVVAGIGLVLVLASLVYLAINALEMREDARPRPQLELLGVEPLGQRFLVRVRVANHGEATAEGLVVAGELQQQGQVLERAELTFDFLPPRSTREAGLFFTRDPRTLHLELLPVAYRVP